MNVSDLRKILGLAELQDEDEDDDSIDEVQIVLEPEKLEPQTVEHRETSSRLIRVRRQSMEQLDLIKVLFRLLFLFMLFYSNSLKIL